MSTFNPDTVNPNVNPIRHTAKILGPIEEITRQLFGGAEDSAVATKPKSSVELAPVAIVAGVVVLYGLYRVIK